jgi:hypothetical protein
MFFNGNKFFHTSLTSVILSIVLKCISELDVNTAFG